MIAVPQVRAVTLKGYIEVARFVGLDPYATLAEAGLSPSGLEDAEARLPAAPVAKLIEDSARLSGCESFGILMQECRTYESLGPSALLFERLPNIRTVLAQISDYRRHMNDLFDVQLGDDDEHPTIEFFHRPDFASIQTINMTVAMAHIALTGASGRMWRPTAVHFHHPAPRDASIFRRFFPAPIHFESSFNGFECSPESLDRPLPGASAQMAENARRLLDGVDLPPEDAPVSDRVIRSIMLFLPSGRATLEEVARSVDTTPRDLQRKLEREGRTFADLLNDARRELSQRYLTNDRQPLTTVAELTGYASPGSFSRWFVTEFGIAPGAWRRSLNVASPQVC